MGGRRTLSLHDGQPVSGSTRLVRAAERLVWADRCRARTSAVRCLNLDVSFPAVRSLTLPWLADPMPTLSRRADWPEGRKRTWRWLLQRYSGFTSSPPGAP